MPSAELIAIGTELLLGETLDTNTQHIARTLRDLGINIYRTTIIGDNKERISSLIQEAMQRSEIVITTGGLGPTIDDPTRAALAQATGRKLEFHQELWETIAARIKKAGRNPGENQKNQAYIPRDGIIIENPVGTAPAFMILTEKNVIISLPGVPIEMKTILEKSIIPFLNDRYDSKGIIKVQVIHTSGAGEGWIDENISDLELLDNPTIGLAAHNGIVDIRITAKASNERLALDLIDGMVCEIHKRLGDFVFGVDEDTLESITMDSVAKFNWRVFCLESGTGGLLDSWLSSLENPLYLGGEIVTPEKGSIETLLLSRRSSGIADVFLGLSITNIQQYSSIIDLSILTPEGDYEHHLTFSGHPDSVPELGVNLILNALRRMIGKMNK
jgi:nicotinamide-nucleotide amidase